MAERLVLNCDYATACKVSDLGYLVVIEEVHLNKETQLYEVLIRQANCKDI